MLSYDRIAWIIAQYKRLHNETYFKNVKKKRNNKEIHWRIPHKTQGNSEEILFDFENLLTFRAVNAIFVKTITVYTKENRKNKGNGA